MSENKQPRIVIIGGGTGLSVLLRGLKKYPVDITAIVTVADDGGSSGRLRNDLDIPAPGDIRNVLAALSDVEPLIEEMFQHRFSNSKDLDGHSLGNLILAAMTSITGSFPYAIQEMSKVLNVRGKVLPATSHNVILNALMEDGTVVVGESSIPEAEKRIKEVFLTPRDATPLPDTIHAIEEADLIVIGPGSLYTSILPNLVVPEIKEAIRIAQAKKVYVCNIMTQAGETSDYTASDHVKALYHHVEQSFVDTILVNKKNIPASVQERYDEEKAKPVIFDTNKLQSLGLHVIAGDIIHLEDGVIRHNTLEVAKILYSIIQSSSNDR